MKSRLLFIALILVSSGSVVRADYLDMLKYLDVSLLCILSWVTAPVVAVLLVLGGYLLISGDSPERRDTGKALIQNALVGLILVVLLIQISIVIGDMEARYWDMCWGRAPPAVNQPPVADARTGEVVNPTGKSVTVDVGHDVYFDGSQSNDPDGSIVKYSWDFDDSDGIQEDATGETTTHQYSSAGTYTVTLTVTDDKGATAADSVAVEVGGGEFELTHEVHESEVTPSG